MNKRILFGVLMICAVAALVAIGTWAYFSDYETSYDNKFTAGSLDLKVDGNDDPNVDTYFDIECVKPGDFGSVEIELSNVGCVDGIADIHLEWLANDENVAVEPELNAGDVADDLADVWDGELAQNLDMKISADLDMSGTYETVVAEGKLSEVWCINHIIGPLNADSAIGLLIEWSVATDVGNIIMTDIVEFDIVFSLNQTVGVIKPFEPHLSNLVQPATAVVCDTVTITVDVTNAGDLGGMVTVSLDIGAWHAEQPVTLAGGQTKTVTFTWHPEAKGDYDVVASLPSEEHLDCSIKVVEPATLVVTGITQPETIQICEALTIEVDVHNAGGVPGAGNVTLTITSEGGATLKSETKSTGTVDPCNTAKVAFGPYHPDETWRGVCTVTTAPPLPAAHTITVLKPATIEVTGIDQPTAVQPCEDITITVGVYNAGDKAGTGTVTLNITNQSGTPVYSESEPTGPLNAGDIGSVAFVVHPLESWVGVCTVTTTPPWVGHVHTITVLVPAMIEVVGFQQPPLVELGTLLPILVDVHNGGGKPGQGPVMLTIINTGTSEVLVNEIKMTPVLAPCDYDKVLFGPYEMTMAWLGVCLVMTTPPGPPHYVMVVPPYIKASSTWDYDVHFALGTEAGDTLAAVVIEDLTGGTGGTGGPVTFRVWYVDQDNHAAEKTDATVTIPAGSLVGTIVAIPLNGTDTGARDVTGVANVTGLSLTTGGAAIVGATSGVAAGLVDMKKAVALCYLDGSPLYVTQDTAQETHLVEFVASIDDLLPACETVPIPPGPAAHAFIDPTFGGVGPTRPLAGTPYTMTTTWVDGYASLTDGTSMYGYVVAALFGAIPLELEMGYHTYVLTGGTNIGAPYAAGNSWTYINEQEGYAMGACSSYALVPYTCSVVASGVTIDVPAGHFTDCFQIVTDNPAALGNKTDYWSPTAQGIVQTVDTETYFPGVETTSLTFYHLVW